MELQRKYTTTMMPPDFCPEILEGPEAQAALDALVARFFPPQEESQTTPAPTVYGGATRPLPTVDDDDAALLEKARRSKNGDQFSILFDHGDISQFPSASEADLALANSLAFWAGPNAMRIDQLMRASALLANPERLKKWDRIHTRGLSYGQATVEKAINGTREFYDPQYGRTRKGLDAGPIGSDDRPEIDYRAGELPQAVAELQSALKGHLYQMGGMLVQVYRLPRRTASSGIRREAGTTIIAPVTIDSLTLLAAQNTRWTRFDARGKAREANPPQEVMRAMLAAQGSWTFPVLTGVISCPTMRHDGTIIDAEGYDKKSGLYADFRNQTFSTVALRPTKEDAAAALNFLLEAVAEFPFESEASRSVMVGAMLTAVLRSSVPTAPLFGISGRTFGTGKSTAGDMIAIISTGEVAAAVDFNANEDEFKKSLFSILLEGAPVTMIDNVVGTLNSSLLNMILSQQSIKGRVLGVSRTATVPTASLWLATGNNLTLSGDMTRRSLYCELDARMERPDERKFSRDIYKWTKENRPQLVHACLTILKAFAAAGKPGADSLRRMNGFDIWSNWIRGALVWLGQADPLDTQRSIEASDPEREALGTVLAAWYECLGSKPVLVNELLRANDASDQRVQLYQSLVAAVASPRGFNVRSVGKWISRYQGRIVQGFKMVNCGTYKGSALWKVEKVS